MCCGGSNTERRRRCRPCGRLTSSGVIPKGPFGWKPGQSAVVELLRRARRRWLRPSRGHEHAGRWVGEARAMRARATSFARRFPIPLRCSTSSTCTFDELLRRARAHADRVIVVRQPWFDAAYSPEEAAHMWHGGVGQAWRTEITTYYSFDVVSTADVLDRRQGRRHRGRAGCRADRPDAGARTATSSNYYDCFHATPAGARAVATAVAAAIVQRTGGPG